MPGCDPGSPSATLRFNGLANGYNRLPRVLAVDSIYSPADANNTLLIVTRIGGDLSTSGAFIGPLFGILFDAQENPYSFTTNAPACQLRRVLSNTFPRTTPRLTQVISAGTTGWMKFWGTNDIGIIGAVINYNPNAKTSPSAYNGGHNLHKLTFTDTVTLTVPVFPPNCS